MTRMSLPLVFIAFGLCLLVSACGAYPRDSDGMTQRASGQGMRVGASHDPPWLVVDADGRVSGPEAELLQAFAAAQGYRLRWQPGGHDALMRQLEHAELHAVVGGYDRKSPWKPRVAWSRPLRARASPHSPMPERRIGLPPGQSAWQLGLDTWLVRQAGTR